VIRLAVIAALSFVPWVAEAKRACPAAQAASSKPAVLIQASDEKPERGPRPGAVNRRWRSDPDWDMSDLVELPDLSVLENLRNLGDLDDLQLDLQLDLPRLIARASHGHDDDEDEDDKDDDDDRAVKDDRGARVYRMREESRPGIPRVFRREHEDDDHEGARPQARGRGSATLAVKGPITFQVRAQSGDVEVVTTDKPQVSISVSEVPPEEVALYLNGDRVEPSFRGRRQLRRGKLHVELPRGSRLDLSSMSGDVSVQRVGEVRIRTMSGDVRLASVDKTDVQTISGDTHIEDARGPVRLHTVSGKGTVIATGATPQLEFQSASGSLEWSGVCGRDCHLSAETVSGDLQLAVDARSSFELSYTSHSGELRDEVNLAVKRAPKRKHGMSGGWMEATFGKGEGVIEADAFSGALVMKKR
jgi:hypothetical protein